MPHPYRYTAPVPKKAATGQVAEVYAQISAEFILADGPLMCLSPAPELLTATWSLLREAQVAGLAPRVNKEIVATAVSAANHCQFCVDAHTALVHAAGEHQVAEAIWRGETPADPSAARLVAWAKATAIPKAAERAATPFPAQLAVEYFGTALVTHFINRVVSSLLNENLLPGRLRESYLVRRVAGRALERAVRVHPRGGESLPLLGGVAPGVSPAWAEKSPAGVAYAALRSAAGAGGALLGSRAWESVLSGISCWNGDDPVAIDERVSALPAAERPGARLALLAALDPHGITDADVAVWRATRPKDADLIRLIAFGAMAAVERIESSLVQSLNPALVDRGSTDGPASGPSKALTRQVAPALAGVAAQS